MKSSFSWSSLFKSPTSRIFFGEPTHGKLKQVKLLCSPTSCTSCHHTLAKLNQETELCITKYIPLCDSPVHTGTTSSMPSAPSETNQVSDCHSSSLTTPSSIRILDISKIEVTNVLIHHVGKNGEHFYGENLIYEYSSKRHIKSKSGLNHGSSLIKVDWGGKLRVNHMHECMPSEVHQGDHDP